MGRREGPQTQVPPRHSADGGAGCLSSASSPEMSPGSDPNEKKCQAATLSGSPSLASGHMTGGHLPAPGVEAPVEIEVQVGALRAQQV